MSESSQTFEDRPDTVSDLGQQAERAASAGIERHYPTASSYVEPFQRKAAEVPERPAVIDPQTRRQLTFAELDRQSGQLASRLLYRDPEPGPTPVIAIFLERSLELALAPLAIWKAGGTYLPIDPNYPSERVALLLEDSGCRIIITKSELAARLPSTGADILCLDAEAAASGAEPAPAVRARADDPAYLIYTSGSTGRPKGVLISHRNLLNHNYAVIEAYGLKPDDRFLQFASISFDISVEEIFPSWLLGAPVIFRSEAAASSIPALLKLAREQSITVLNLPTAVLARAGACAR